eukprot:jgi/Galph1/920/GphlegSOOS_G5684.1
MNPNLAHLQDDKETQVFTDLADFDELLYNIVNVLSKKGADSRLLTAEHSSIYKKLLVELGVPVNRLIEKESTWSATEKFIGLLRRLCEKWNGLKFLPILRFFEYGLETIALPGGQSQGKESTEESEGALRRLLQLASHLVVHSFGEDSLVLADTVSSILRIILYLLVKFLEFPANRSKTLTKFSVEYTYSILFICYRVFPEEESWIGLLPYNSQFRGFLENKPNVESEQLLTRWTCIQSIRVLCIHRRIDSFHDALGSLWPSLHSLIIQTLKYEDECRKNESRRSYHSTFPSLIRYCISMLRTEYLERYIQHLLLLLMPLSQDFEQTRRLEAIRCFRRIICRCSQQTLVENRLPFYTVFRVFCHFREPDILDDALATVIQFISLEKPCRNNVFYESCSSDLYQLLDSYIDLISYCSLGSSSFSVDMNELRLVVSRHLVSLIHVMNIRLYPCLRRLLPSLCDMLERCSASPKSAEQGSLQYTLEALQELLSISQPFIRFYSQTLLGCLFHSVVYAKQLLNAEYSSVLWDKWTLMIDTIRLNSESRTFRYFLEVSEKIAKQNALHDLIDFIIEYRKHVESNGKRQPLEDDYFETFDELFRDVSNPFKNSSS